MRHARVPFKAVCGEAIRAQPWRSCANAITTAQATKSYQEFRS
jgi:hypothetical protein